MKRRNWIVGLVGTGRHRLVSLPPRAAVRRQAGRTRSPRRQRGRLRSPPAARRCSAERPVSFGGPRDPGHRDGAPPGGRPPGAPPDRVHDLQRARRAGVPRGRRRCRRQRDGEARPASSSWASSRAPTATRTTTSLPTSTSASTGRSRSGAVASASISPPRHSPSFLSQESSMSLARAVAAVGGALGHRPGRAARGPGHADQVHDQGREHLARARR